jgi:phage terminase large subunit
MLADRAGVLVRSGTPRGRGLLETAYNRAKTTAGYSVYLLDYTKTQALEPEAIERLKSEMTEEEFAQELECSFVAPNSGTYYGKLLNEAEKEGRITEVPYEREMLVTTAWDLGIDDSTAIWFAQITRGGQWRIIDYYENSGVSLEHYAEVLDDRGYHYDQHLLPHDAEVRELGTGKSRVETLHSLGLRRVTVVPRQDVADGINAVRLVLPRCWFDAVRCETGLRMLRAYRREWNESAQVWRANPVHDFASHGADSFRTLAMGVHGASEKFQPRDAYTRTYRPKRRGGSWMAA